MQLNMLFRHVSFLLRKRHHLAQYASAAPGSVDWLVGAEIKYGGLATKVPRNRVSPKDPRSEKQLSAGGMAGGDRMLHHGYAGRYSQALLPYVNRSAPVTLAEFGILKGTGVAMWCELFPAGRVLGLDIDLGHIQANMDNLRGLGAFKQSEPELYEFDQFVDNAQYLGKLLEGDKLEICIDDGYHSNESILTTMKSVMPHLADHFVYLIEDNKHVHAEIAATYPSLRIEREGDLTVVSPRSPQ